MSILSHTWEEGEVSFQDTQGGDADQKAGHDKIKRFCKVAAAQGFEHAWTDTCRIDKNHDNGDKSGFAYAGAAQKS